MAAQPHSRLAKSVTEERNKELGTAGHPCHTFRTVLQTQDVMKSTCRSTVCPSLYMQHGRHPEVLYVDKLVNGKSSRWDRTSKLVNAREARHRVDSDQKKGPVDLGTMFDRKGFFAVNQIKQ